MTINWKVLVALVVIVAVSYWAFDSLRIRSYSGSDLSFDMGAGPVTVTNSSDVPVAARITGTGTRPFNVTSETDGISGTSVREGNGIGTIQSYQFFLPPGATTLMVDRGTVLQLATTAGSSLAATVQIVTDAAKQTTLLVTAAVVLIGLFFISYSTNHQWLRMLRGKAAPTPVAVPSAVSADGGQGRTIKSYGDNSP